MKELLETGTPFDLDYNEKYDLLVGKIKGLSVVIKENNETRSYGCLIWVNGKNGDSSELDSYLSGQVADKPHIIKHYKAAGRGAAFALVKYNDPTRNINNLNRFLGDLSDDLFAHDYVNCCYSCGRTEHLGIYADEGSVVQYCDKCCEGERIDIGAASANNEEAERLEREEAERLEREEAERLAREEAERAAREEAERLAREEAERLAREEAERAAREEAERLAREEAERAAREEAERLAREEAERLAREEAERLAREEAERAAREEAERLAREEASKITPEELERLARQEEENAALTADSRLADDADLMAAMAEAAAEIKVEEIAGSMEDLLADGNDVPEPEKAVEGEVISTEGDHSDISSFVMDENDRKGEETHLPENNAAMNISSGSEPDGALDSLLFSEEDKQNSVQGDAMAFGNANTYTEEAENTDDVSADGNETDDNANIYGLMLGSEQDIAEMGDTEVTELTSIEIGKGADLEVRMRDEDEPGGDEAVEVTEIYDDSNEGEDFDIEELDAGFNRPTDTAGEQIKASETPLEADGTVPMVNPNSDFAESKPSSANDKSAVRAFAFGSYDNANTAEEPVRYDGRPKGYQGSDPRMGDEMGPISRDYARQQASPRANTAHVSEQRVVSRMKRGSSKPLKELRQPKHVSGGYGQSNAALGIVASLLIGIIGCAVWCAAGYILGFIETLKADQKAIFMSVFAFFPTMAVFIGYKVGGDCFDGKGYVISSLLSLVMDALGLAAVFVTEYMQKASKELGYGIPVDRAVEKVFGDLSGLASNELMMRQIGISAAVMVISLVVAIVVAKKKN